MNSDYFSVDAILAENQKIQCTFKEDLPELGHLGGGGSERHIKAGNKAAIPIWIAYAVIFSDWADFIIPAAFNTRVKNALKAESRSVRLSNLVGVGASWYGFGKTIMDSLDGEQAEGLSKMLDTTFQSRLLEVVDQAHHFAVIGTTGGSTMDAAQLFREGLDSTERELFALAQASAKETKWWYETSDKSRR